MSDPFVVIVGTQSSGSSCIAGLAYHVGLWLGNRLTGRYGSNPEGPCGFEDRRLTVLAKRHCPFLCRELTDPVALRRGLTKRVRQLQKEASERDTLAGGKLPRLSFFGHEFLEICQGNVLAISCERPLEDSIRSTSRLMPRNKRFPKIQEWLHEGKERFLASLPAVNSLRVEYYSVLSNPELEARRIADFLGLNHSPTRIAKAVQVVRPHMKHIG